MADEGAVAVLEAPVETTQAETAISEPSQSTPKEKTAPQPTDKTDGRNKPDALRKRLSELRRQADTITDPVAKAAHLADAKALDDYLGKARAYEREWPTVREAREVKALFESFGGREGVTGMHAKLAEIEQVDNMLSAGDPAVVDKLWKEAPDGVAKIVPAIVDRLAKEKPEEYQKFIAPHTIKFLDSSGFPDAFDRMASLYEAGKTDEAMAIRQQMVEWVAGQRQAAAKPEPRVDPEIERLRKENETIKAKDTERAVSEAYSSVVDHSGPIIDKYLKPIVSKLGLSAEQYNLLRGDVWNHLQTTRNADQTYKTVSGAKYKQGIETVVPYMKQWTEDNAQEAARHMANLRYGHQLKNGAIAGKVDATKQPTTPGIVAGTQPSPSEIDYGPKGIALARKMGYKDIGDMVMDGKAPLKVGGVRKWR